MNKADIKELDVVYLDSYDVDLNNPEPSENHGYNANFVQLKNI